MTVSENFNDRPCGSSLDMLVLHYTGMPTCDAARARLCDPQSKVSAHYLIEENGTVHSLVDEEKRAWHAGLSYWRGVDDVNGHSIGIELDNPGHEFGYKPFAEPQMVALIHLAQSIVQRLNILPRNVVGHSDIAPQRKQDPGELFDWHRLAVAGVGLWVEDAPPAHLDEDKACLLLAEFGYAVTDVKATITAFQRHFRPTCVDGVMDTETGGILTALMKIL